MSTQNVFNVTGPGQVPLHTAIALKPENVTVTVADISQIPLYNEDVRQQGFQPAVETLRRQIAAADALLFACPEYNYGMSGVLKNAIDWASRPPDQPFAGKPSAKKPSGERPSGRKPFGEKPSDAKPARRDRPRR